VAFLEQTFHRKWLDPTKSTQEEVNQLLISWSDGDRTALDRLIPIVYQELRLLAHHYMRRERANNSFQTTALVNEAYLRLTGYRRMKWQNRAHFFAIAAQVMRRILVEHARGKNSAKRGMRQVSLDESAMVSPGRSAEVIAVNEALTELESWDPRKGRIVELRFFGGLNIEETAEVLKISPTTVQRDWRSAKAWLYRAITEREH
jgi:RNA polymerase sigma factor (TIGR02999 family)